MTFFPLIMNDSSCQRAKYKTLQHRKACNAQFCLYQFVEELAIIYTLCIKLCVAPLKSELRINYFEKCVASFALTLFNTLIEQKRLNHKFFLLFLFPSVKQFIHSIPWHFSGDQKKKIHDNTWQYLYILSDERCKHITIVLPLIIINLHQRFQKKLFFFLPIFVSFPFTFATITTAHPLYVHTQIQYHNDNCSAE